MESSQAPSDRMLLEQLLKHMGTKLPAEWEGKQAQIEQIAWAFGHIPYENLSKVVRWNLHQAPHFETPAEVVAGHLKWGSGGTCFSLTNTLVAFLRAIDVEASPILADRSYGSDTHCAALVTEGDQRWIVDPGYLIFEPVPVSQPIAIVRSTPIQTLELVPKGGDRWDLFTTPNPPPNQATSSPAPPQASRTFRLTYKATAVDHQEFQRAWLASFDWEMMQYPVISQVIGSEQIFVRGNRWQSRRAEGVLRTELDQETWTNRLVQELGLHPDLITAALNVFKRPTGEA